MPDESQDTGLPNVSRTGLPNWQRLALTSAAGLLTAIPIILGVRNVIQPGIDLEVYLAAGRMIADGLDPYAADFGSDLPTPLPFTYPPIAALLAVPLQIPPFWLVYVLWTVATVVAVSWLSLRSGILGPKPGILGCIALGVWSVALYPVADSLVLGQVSGLLVTLVFASALKAVDRGGGGILVGVFTAIKLTPGLFLLWFALIPRVRGLIGGLLTLLVLTAIGFVLLPQGSVEFFSQLLPDAGRVGDPASNINQSLNGVVSRVSAPSWVWMIGAVAIAAGGLLGATRLARSGATLAAVALVGVTTVLISPISWPHHAIWTIPAIGACVSSTDRVVRVVGWASAVLLVLRFPLWGEYLITADWLVAISENLHVVVYLALFLALLPVRDKARDAAPDDENVALHSA